MSRKGISILIVGIYWKEQKLRPLKIAVVKDSQKKIRIETN